MFAGSYTFVRFYAIQVKTKVLGYWGNHVGNMRTSTRALNGSNEHTVSSGVDFGQIKELLMEEKGNENV